MMGLVLFMFCFLSLWCTLLARDIYKLERRITDWEGRL